MINWKINNKTFDVEKIAENGNKFFSGNGYLGVRGNFPEDTKSQFVAINLSGIFDQVGDGWREPINAPNPLFTKLVFNNQDCSYFNNTPKEYEMELDYRHGVLKTNCVLDSVKITAERFAYMKETNAILMKYSLVANVDGEVELYTGVDGDVWDINGPHLENIEMSYTRDTILIEAETHENKDKVVVVENCVCNFGNEVSFKQSYVEEDKQLLRKITFNAIKGVTYTFYKYTAVFTSKDCDNIADTATELVERLTTIGYDEVFTKHKETWENIWKLSEVVIEGDDEAMEALNYSTYHLNCIAPRHSESLSIAARGLSGQTYKGAVFWDTEMFMLDFFLNTDPTVAKTLLKYRVDTLEGAKKKAKDYGFDGAFYAWESQEGGFDACSDYNVVDVFTGRPMRTYFRDKQVHISSAIAYGIMKYTNRTGDKELLNSGGVETIIECANFYYSLLISKINSSKYEIHDVIGPDEYHERVNNNAYTNRMAKFVFDSAIELLKEYGLSESIKSKYDTKNLLENFADATSKIYIPQPDKDTLVIEQFDGYSKLEDVEIAELKTRLLNEKEYWGGAYGIASETKVIKQADVVTMLNLFNSDYDNEVLLKNWEYYEPRTEHGSSLSACMYALVACKCDKPDVAYDFFMKSATADIRGGGKQWAGLIYIGGTHPAAAGGAYMNATEGFAGLSFKDGKVNANPKLPTKWSSLSFKTFYGDKLYEVRCTKTVAEIVELKF